MKNAIEMTVAKYHIARAKKLVEREERLMSKAEQHQNKAVKHLLSIADRIAKTHE